MKKTAAVCGIILGVFLLGSAVQAGTVERSMNFRSEPSAKGGLIGSVPKGATVTVLSSQNGWDYISYNGANGWIHGGNVSNQPAAQTATSDTGTAASSAGSSGQSVKVLKGMNFRAKPGMDGSIIGGIPAGTTVQYLGSSNGWDKVVYNGVTGWIASGRTAAVSTAASASTGSSANAQAGTLSSAAGTTKTVTNTMNFRASGNLAGSLIGLIPSGSKVIYVTCADGWEQVIYNGQSGWIKGGNTR